MVIKWVGSPNFDNNRKPITTVVLHWIVGTLEAADAVFQDDLRDTSAHYGIGQTEIHQYVEEKNVAYHAGNYEVNQRSIGIEHEGGPDLPITDAVYNQSIELVADICKRYNIPPDDFHIIPHRQIKATQCPGTLDIQRIINGVKSAITAQPIAQLTRQNVIDTYRALCGEEPTEDEITYRMVTQNINLYDMIKEICSGDERFKKTWIPEQTNTITIPAPVESTTTSSTGSKTPKHTWSGLIDYLVKLIGN